MNHRILTAIALGVTLACTVSAVTACSSSDSTESTPTPTAASTSSADASTGTEAVDGSQPTDTAAEPLATEVVSPVPDATAPAGQPLDICATVPALDVISTVLTEPASAVTDLGRGPGEEKCEATTDGGVDTAQFGRLSPADRAQIDEFAAQLGYPVTDLDDPTLPGAYTYAGVVAVIIDGTEWSVQVITFDTITDPTSPAAIERSATLLRAWLPMLGLA